MSKKKMSHRRTETQTVDRVETDQNTNEESESPSQTDKVGNSETPPDQKNDEEEQKDLLAELKSNCTILQEERDSLKDQLLRKQADFENYRKRMFKDKQEFMKYANSSLLLDLTNVIDDFERAIRSAEESKDFTSFHEGVALIERQLVKMLEKSWNLKRFDSAGDDFDPEKHQAIASVESDDIGTPKVVEDFQRGYMLHDRILRPAIVKVAKPKEKNAQSDDADETEESPHK